MNHSHTRIATVTIELCKRDGRKRYGLESVGRIVAGQQFTFTPGDYERRFHAAFVDVGGGASGYVTRDVAEAIEAGSTVKQPDNFADVACKFAYPVEAASDIIDHLMKIGKLKIEDIEGAIKTICEVA